MKHLLFIFCLLGGLNLTACGSTHAPPSSSTSPTVKRGDTHQAHRRGERFLKRVSKL